MKLFGALGLLLIGVLNMAAACVDVNANEFNRIDWDENAYEFSSVMEQTINFENKTEFNLDNPAGEIVIEGWDQPTVQLNATIWAKKESTLNSIEIKVEESADTVSVRSINNKKNHRSWKVDYVINVPLGSSLDVDQGAGQIDIGNHSGNVRVSMGAGQINLENLLANQLHVDLGAGEANVTTLEGQEISVDIGAGQLNLKPQTSLMFENVDVDVSTGEANLYGVEAKRIHVDIGMGHADLRLYPTSSYNIHADVGIGNVSIHGFGDMDLRVNGFIGRNARAVLGNGDGEIEIDVGTGDIDVHPWSE